MASTQKYQVDYQELVDILALPYQSLDAAGNFLLVNQAWLELFDCQREAVIGRFFGDIMCESTRHLLGITFEGFKRDGFVSSPVFEAEHQRSGQHLLITVNGRVERDEKGNFVRTHCLLTDVTARAAAEAEVMALSDLLKQVTTQIPGMVFQYRLRPDGSACFPYASAGIRELLLVAPDDVRDDASRAFAHVHPDDLASLQDSIQKSALTGRPWRHRFRVQPDHGPLLWLQGNAAPLREADGGYLWHGFLTDVTAEVEIDTQLRLSASVFANSQEGITITDANGLIVDVNPAFTRISGYRRDEVLGRSPKMHSSGQQNADFYARMWAAISETGGWRGEIWNRNKAGEEYPVLLSIAAVKDDAGRITHYIGSYSDIKELKNREAQLDQLAHFDALTGLPNRRLLNDRLQQAMAHARRSGKIMAVGVVDLDNFKPINDTLGHAAGDAVLVEIAQRLSKCLRENDTVARTGGDEFVLLLDGLDRADECDVVMTRLLHDVTQSIRLGENESQVASVSASIGLTLFPQDGADAEVLLRHADQAMYQAKEAGRNRYQLFNVAHD